MRARIYEKGKQLALSRRVFANPKPAGDTSIGRSIYVVICSVCGPYAAGASIRDCNEWLPDCPHEVPGDGRHLLTVMRAELVPMKKKSSVKK